MKSFFKIFSLLILFASAQVISKEHKFPDANLMVTFPDTWNIEFNNGVLVATVGNDDIAIVFTLIQSEGLDRAMEAGMTEINKQYTDLVFDEVKEETTDFVTVVYTDGKGKRTDDDGKLVDVELTVGLVPGSGSRYMFIHGVATTEMLQKHIDDIGFILKNIKPIKRTP